MNGHSITDISYAVVNTCNNESCVPEDYIVAIKERFQQHNSEHADGERDTASHAAISPRQGVRRTNAGQVENNTHNLGRQHGSEGSVLLRRGTLVPSVLANQAGVLRACLKSGQISDVCPTPGVQMYKHCGTENADTDHLCEPKCVLSSEVHQTGSRECQQNLKKAWIPPGIGGGGAGGARHRALSNSKSDSSVRACGAACRRWFSSDGGSSTSRSR